jgi:hypothetical protein
LNRNRVSFLVLQSAGWFLVDAGGRVGWRASNGVQAGENTHPNSRKTEEGPGGSNVPEARGADDDNETMTIFDAVWQLVACTGGAAFLLAGACDFGGV